MTIEGYSELSDSLGKVGYETMFVDKWEDADTIEKELWRTIALNMIRELWKQYQSH